MTSRLRSDLHNLGFLARTHRLRALGHSRRALDNAVGEGWLLRPTRGWLATTDASRDGVIAVLNRGVLTDASALESHELWSGLDRRVHVLVPPNSRGMAVKSPLAISRFARGRMDSSGLVRHWGEQRATVANEHDWRVSVVDALLSFGLSQPHDHFVAAVDNALFKGKLRPSELPLLFRLLPGRMAALQDRINGKAESGTESLARFRIEAIARRVEIQVKIGRHRVDILIDGWLIVEIQSEEWHGRQRLEDSQRATWLEGKGYRAMSFDYAEVMFGWEKCEAAILEALRRPPGVAPR